MIVRELLALIGFEVDEQSLIKAENAFEAIATQAFKMDQAIQKLGHISTAGFQELEYAARQSGLGVQELGQRMSYFGRAVTEAIYRGGRPGAAFYQMGLSAIELKDMLAKGGLPQILGVVADKFNTMTDAAKRDFIAISLFSQGGAQMVPFLSQGSAGIAKWGVEARRTGIIMNEGMIKQGIELYHLLIELEASIKGLTYAVLGPFLERFIKMTAAFTLWIQQHREIIAFRIGNVIEAIGKAFEFAWYMVQNFTGTMATLGAILFATMFPLTAFFASLFLIAEDLYSYFALGDKDSVTYLIILAFQALQKMFQEMSLGDIIAAGFKKGLEAAKEFFAYLEEKTALSTPDEYGRRLGVAGQWLQFFNTLPGVKQLVTSMGVNPEDPKVYSDLFGPSVAQVPFSPLRPEFQPGGSSSGGFIVNEINFYGDATPQAQEDFVHKLDYWWSQKTRQASRR